MKMKSLIRKLKMSIANVNHSLTGKGQSQTTEQSASQKVLLVYENLSKPLLNPHYGMPKKDDKTYKWEIYDVGQNKSKVFFSS